MHVREIEKDLFEKEVLEATTPVVVDFWAPWCGPCKMIAPLLEEVAAHFHERVKIVKVNIDDAPDLASRFGIRSIPTLLLFKAGKPVADHIGAADKDALKKWIEGHI